MVSLPNLPTDNLYKFMALSGVVLMLFSIWMYETTYLKLSAEGIQLLRKLSVLVASQDEIKQKSGLIQKRYGNILNKSNKDDGLTEKINDLYQKNQITNKTTLEIMHDVKLHEISVLRWGAIYIYFLFAIFALGLMTSVVGFLFWYKRVQKYQDIRLKTAAKIDK